MDVHAHADRRIEQIRATRTRVEELKGSVCDEGAQSQLNKALDDLAAAISWLSSPRDAHKPYVLHVVNDAIALAAEWVARVEQQLEDATSLNSPSSTAKH